VVEQRDSAAISSILDGVHTSVPMQGEHKTPREHSETDAGDDGFMDPIVWMWRASEDCHISPDPMSHIHVGQMSYQVNYGTMFYTIGTQ
jgi:hypothetical protein